MNLPIPRQRAGRTPLRAVVASFWVFQTTGFCFTLLQQGEFISQKPALAQHQVQALQNPLAIAAVQQTEVPDLITHGVEDARKMLRASKLLMDEPKFVPSPQPPGTVVRQYPEAHSKVKIGASVLVWVSAERPTPQPTLASQPNYGMVPAPRLVSVPLLIHHRREDAIQMLKLAGLQVSSADIKEMPSEEDTGIVLSQEPVAGTLVRPGAFVGFNVSRQITRELVLKAFPTSLGPGESVTFSVDLTPPFPGAEYQFNFGKGSPAPAAWTPDPQAQYTYRDDGDYEAIAVARWNGGRLESNSVHIVVHPVKYKVQLFPDPLEVKPGDTVSFRAEVDPSVESATYIYHFGDDTKDQISSSSISRHSYPSKGKYSARVTARISDTKAEGGPLHAHDFSSRPVQLLVEEPSPSIVLYVMGAAVLLSVAGYGARKIWKGKRQLQILVHKDLGIQGVHAASPIAVDVEIVTVRSWGEQSIKSRGPLCAGIEPIHE